MDANAADRPNAREIVDMLSQQQDRPLHAEGKVRRAAEPEVWHHRTKPVSTSVLLLLMVRTRRCASLPLSCVLAAAQLVPGKGKLLDGIIRHANIVREPDITRADALLSAQLKA